MVEPYNAVLSGHFNMDHSSVSFMFDNQALFDICKKNLSVERPSYQVPSCFLFFCPVHKTFYHTSLIFLLLLSEPEPNDCPVRLEHHLLDQVPR